jgi:hypothetical protein
MANGMDVESYNRALSTDDTGNLFVGSDFVTIGSASFSHIARWDGAEWSALGSGVNNTSISILATSDGHVYSAGYSPTPETAGPCILPRPTSSRVCTCRRYRCRDDNILFGAL